MTIEKKTIKIPFDDNGNQLHSSYYATEWKDNYGFEANLEVLDYSHSRSSAVFILADSDGHEYTMSLRDFFDLIPRLEDGSIYSNWTFAKKGQNYFIVEAQ